VHVSLVVPLRSCLCRLSWSVNHVPPPQYANVDCIYSPALPAPERSIPFVCCLPPARINHLPSSLASALTLLLGDTTTSLCDGTQLLRESAPFSAMTTTSTSTSSFHCDTLSTDPWIGTTSTLSHHHHHHHHHYHGHSNNSSNSSSTLLSNLVFRPFTPDDIPQVRDLDVRNAAPAPAP